MKKNDKKNTFLIIGVGTLIVLVTVLLFVSLRGPVTGKAYMVNEFEQGVSLMDEANFDVSNLNELNTFVESLNRRLSSVEGKIIGFEKSMVENKESIDVNYQKIANIDFNLKGIKNSLEEEYSKRVDLFNDIEKGVRLQYYKENAIMNTFGSLVDSFTCDQACKIYEYPGCIATLVTARTPDKQSPNFQRSIYPCDKKLYTASIEKDFVASCSCEIK